MTASHFDLSWYVPITIQEGMMLPIITIMISSYSEWLLYVFLKPKFWCPMTTYPAYQSRAHLTEEFQIKVFDAGIELMSFEKVINQIA